MGIDRNVPERLAAWLITGPLGHLYSVCTDVVLLWGRLLLARVRRRAPSSS